MKTIIVILLMISITYSCQNKSKENKAILLSKLCEMKNVSRKPNCFVLNKIDFRELVKAMGIMDYLPVEISKWPYWYKNHIDDKLYGGTEVFVRLPINTQWKGKENTIRAPEQIVTFENALVTEVVLRRYGDVKIVQFLFKTNDGAEKAIAKMKLVSAYTISTSGLKNPNYYFIKDCAIYFVRVRAASFPIGAFRKVFEERHGKVKVLRW